MPRARVRRLVALAVVALTLGGCADTSGTRAAGGAKTHPSSMVDASAPPFINALAPDPDGRSLLLSTNRGLYRVRDGRATLVPAKISSTSGSSPLGKLLLVEPAGKGPGELIGSGHPDIGGSLPRVLGLLRSHDDGVSWEPVSQLGTSDFHTIHVIGGVIYAADGAQGALAVSDDDGKTFQLRLFPLGISYDMAVDPADTRKVVFTNDTQILRSSDGGATWRPIADAKVARVEWPAGGVLMRADDDGRFYTSSDGGTRFKQVGKIAGVPQQLLARSPTTAYVALPDASIVKTIDGGRTWATVFTAPAGP